MVLASEVSVNELVAQGKNFPWTRPRCPHCREWCWWHGFVLAFFSMIPAGVYIRRCFCPHCKSVHRLKPVGYFRRFRWSQAEIRGAVETRQDTGQYPKGVAPRETVRRWWRSLAQVIAKELGISFAGTRLAGFNLLFSQGRNPVSLATVRTNQGIIDAPYRSLPLPPCGAR
jgi:glutaredoxin